MFEIFNEDGHISDYGFYKLCNEEASEMERFEISEHLSFCDECIERYTDILSSGKLLSPPETFTVSTMKKIKHSALKVIYSKYFSAAIAAGIAILFWVNGVFNINFDKLDKGVYSVKNIPRNSITYNISSKFNYAIDNVFWKN